MRAPNFDTLKSLKESQYKHLSNAKTVHPNPRFYKYYWWVFWKESPVDGDKFLTSEYRLNTATALKLIDDLKAKDEPYYLYNQSLPRRDPANPFDDRLPRWQDAEWALALDDDPDPFAPEPYAGHK